MTQSESEKTKLEPCPFCGHDAARIRPNVHTSLWQVQCDGCWATSVTSNNKYTVIAAWNLRTERWAEAIEAAAKAAESFHDSADDYLSLNELVTHIADRIRALPVPPLNKER